MGEMIGGGQMSPDRMRQMGEMMQQMGRMMGGMGQGGRSSMGPMPLSDMAGMMAHMAEMQKRMSEMMGTAPQPKWPLLRCLGRS
jgi:hypothetical protein